MKSNLKEQVAGLQKEIQELTKRFETLQNRIDNHLVPRIHKLDKEIVGLSTDSIVQRISELEDWIEKSKAINRAFFNEFNEFVSVVGPHYHALTPEEAMTTYVEMMGKFFKTVQTELTPEIVVEELGDDSK